MNDLRKFASDETLALNGLGGDPKTRTERSTSSRSVLEQKFEHIWNTLGLPNLDTEYTFHDHRDWRFDYACPDVKVAIEVEGVNYGGKSRHRTPGGFEDDAEKYHEATRMGWTVWRITPRMLDAPHLEDIAKMIQDRRK